MAVAAIAHIVIAIFLLASWSVMAYVMPATAAGIPPGIYEKSMLINKNPRPALEPFAKLSTAGAESSNKAPTGGPIKKNLNVIMAIGDSCRFIQSLTFRLRGGGSRPERAQRAALNRLLGILSKVNF